MGEKGINPDEDIVRHWFNISRPLMPMETASIAAMYGILAGAPVKLDFAPDLIAREAVILARALMKELEK